jgi:hypothetical protein
MALAFRLASVLPERDSTGLTLVPRRVRRLPLPVVMVAVVVVCMFTVVSLTTHMAGQQLRIDRLNSDIIRARNNFDKLRAERARFQSPQYLTEKAKAMGMVPGTQTKMVEVPVDVAILVASGVGKVDSDVADSKESPLDQFGRMKQSGGATP